MCLHAFVLLGLQRADALALQDELTALGVSFGGLVSWG